MRCFSSKNCKVVVSILRKRLPDRSVYFHRLRTNSPKGIHNMLVKVCIDEMSSSYTSDRAVGDWNDDSDETYLLVGGTLLTGGAWQNVPGARINPPQ
jgi:hypothetical protein